MLSSHWTIVCWSEETWDERAKSLLSQQAGSSLGRLAGQIPLLFMQRGKDPPTKQGLREDCGNSSFLRSRTQISLERFSDSKYLSVLLLGSLGGRLKYFGLDSEREFLCLSMQLCRTALTLSRPSTELTRVSRQGSQLARCLSGNPAHVHAFLQGNRAVRTTERELIICVASAPLPTLRGGFALPQSLARCSVPRSQQLWAYQRLVPFILPFALSSQEYQRGEVCPTVNPCSCQRCSKPSPSESKGGCSSCSSSPDEGQAQPSTARTKHIQFSQSHSLPSPTPAFILLMQIY